MTWSHFVQPKERMFVIVLRHVVRQTQSAPPVGGQYAKKTNFIRIARTKWLGRPLRETVDLQARRPSIAFSMVTSSGIIASPRRRGCPRQGG